MTKREKFERAIKEVARTTEQSKEQVAKKLLEKDDWTWFLVLEAEKTL